MRCQSGFLCSFVRYGMEEILYFKPDSNYVMRAVSSLLLFSSSMNDGLQFDMLAWSALLGQKNKFVAFFTMTGVGSDTASPAKMERSKKTHPIFIIINLFLSIVKRTLLICLLFDQRLQFHRSYEIYWFYQRHSLQNQPVLFCNRLMPAR